MITETAAMPQWMWSKGHECVVEVLRRGHFPTSMMVRKPDDQEVEVEETDLVYTVRGSDHGR